jgi:hypothetical protein
MVELTDSAVIPCSASSTVIEVRMWKPNHPAGVDRRSLQQPSDMNDGEWAFGRR